MDKQNENIKITDADLSFIEKELSQTNKVLSLYELTKKLAFKKTASQLSKEVKKYDPYCQYEVGDLIYKKYDEPLMVSSKGVEPFDGAVVIVVIKKITYENFNCEMLEVDYTGGGTFRKHIDYMKKTKTQVLLPSNLEGKALAPEMLKKEEDPRLHQLPMANKDLKTLEKYLGTVLSKSAAFFNWNDLWQQKEKQVEIPQEKIKEIENHFLKTNKSATTTELVSQLFNLDPSNDLFDIHCISLNYILEKKFKKTFTFVSSDNWGKWHLKKILDSLLENLPLSSPKAKLPPFEEEKKTETAQAQKFPFRVYLTWREILSGGLKIPRSLNKELSHSREYVFTDIESGKDYTVYYFSSPSIFLGLKEFYESNNVPQGASLSLEKKGPTHISFWLKTSKKKLSVSKVAYDPKEDIFSETGEEVFTFSLPNKIIHIEIETLNKLFSLYGQRDDMDLRELLILIFKNFGLEGEALFLHFLRAFHLVDMLKQTNQEDVEKTLLFSPEFSRSEKNKGVFFYHEKIKTEGELKPEEPVEIPLEMLHEEKLEEYPDEVLPELGTIEEIPLPEPPKEREEIIEEVKVQVPSELQKEEIQKRLKKEKPPKKKKRKAKIDKESTLRMRKGEKKFIEERIEFEESEQEALIAVKAKEKKEDVGEEIAAYKAKEKKEEYEPIVTQKPEFGIFAEKLKSALDTKKKKKKKK